MIKRVKVTQGKHRVVGAKMIEWALGISPKPTTIPELEKEFGNAVELDPMLTKVKVIDTPMDTVLFRLPPKQMIQDYLARANDPNFSLAEYTLPSYYGITPDNLNMTPLELFRARIGDYTTGECE